MNLVRDGDTGFPFGVDDSATVSAYQQGELALLVNGRVRRNGFGIQRMPGGRWAFQQVASSTPVVALHPFVLTNGVRRMLAVTNTKMYRSGDNDHTATTAWTDAGAVATSSDPLVDWCLFEHSGSRAVVCLTYTNSGAAQYYITAATATAISNIPSGSRWCTSHGNRLIVAGGQGSTVSASKVNDLNTWAAPDGWSVQCDTDDGDTDVIGLHSIGPLIMVFKRKSVGYIEGYGYTTLQVNTGERGLSKSIGCMTHRSIQSVGEHGVVWLSRAGWVFYQLGGVPTLISNHNRAVLESIDWEEIYNNPQVVDSLYLQEREEYWCTIPIGGETRSFSQNGKNTNTIWVWRPPSGDRPAASWLMQPPDPSSPGNTYYAVSIDANGYLCLVTPSTGAMVTTTPVTDGYLKICDSREIGQMLVLRTSVTPSDYLMMAGPHNASPRSLAVFRSDADQKEYPIMGGGGSSRCYILYDDSTSTFDNSISQSQDIPMWLRTRPYTAGDPLTRKKAKRVTVQSNSKVDHTLNISVATDLVPGTAQAVTESADANSTFDGVRDNSIRVGGRGYQHQVRIDTTDDCTITAIALDAQPLQDRR